MTEAPVAAPVPDAEPPAAAPPVDDLKRLLDDARSHLAGGGGASEAVQVLIRAVELLAGL